MYFSDNFIIKMYIKYKFLTIKDILSILKKNVRITWFILRHISHIRRSRQRKNFSYDKESKILIPNDPFWYERHELSHDFVMRFVLASFS